MLSTALLSVARASPIGLVRRQGQQHPSDEGRNDAANPTGSGGIAPQVWVCILHLHAGREREKLKFLHKDSSCGCGACPTWCFRSDVDTDECLQPDERHRSESAEWSCSDDNGGDGKPIGWYDECWTNSDDPACENQADEAYTKSNIRDVSTCLYEGAGRPRTCHLQVCASLILLL